MRKFPIHSALAALFLALIVSPAMAQDAPAAAAPATFSVADVHVAPYHLFPFNSGPLVHGDRYFYHQATMLDMISNAYGLDSTNVQGGPSWLEMDHFEIAAKLPEKTPTATQKLMLKALLVDRFKLVAHMGMAPMPANLLEALPGKPKMTVSDGSKDAGCKFNPPAGQSPMTLKVVPFTCSNMTMEQFAEWLHGFGGGTGTNYPVIDTTNLKGSWDFNINFTPKQLMARAGADGVTLEKALEDQLGLKMELKTAPREVLLVDSVNEKPTPNVANLNELLPPQPPAQFEVATIKPSKPDEQPMGRINGGQVDVRNLPLRFLIAFAWDLNMNDHDQPVNAPKWIDSDKFDILAKADNSDVLNNGPNKMSIDIEDLRSMIQALIIDRFQMKSHMEDRMVEDYTLTAPNPKLKKADPTERTKCFEGPGPDGKDPRNGSAVLNRLLTCQNMTMAQFAKELEMQANGFIYNPVKDSTGLTGGYDFTISFSSADLVKGGAPAAGAAPAAGSAASAGGPASANSMSTASEPNGAISVFDAINKELGLKLEKQKRMLPVLVIDSISETPTDN